MKSRYRTNKSKDGKVIQPDAVPGDFIWQDTNNDGRLQMKIEPIVAILAQNGHSV